MSYEDDIERIVRDTRKAQGLPAYLDPAVLDRIARIIVNAERKNCAR